MILLHRLKGEPVYINHRLIETMEKSSDTVLALTNERRYIVKESPAEILDLIREFESQIFRMALADSTDKLDRSYPGT